MSKGTFDAMDITSYNNPFIVKHGVQFMVGNFTVMPFDVIHDAPNPFGYLIHHKECGTCLFITDTMYSRYKFKNLNHIMLEVNYSDEILNENIINGKVHYTQLKRLTSSHLSLKTAKALLMANDLSSVRNIVLLHLSERNGNETLFKKEIEETTGKQVYIAKKGLEVNFNLNPF